MLSTSEPRARGSGDHGSVLMLMPAAVLIVLLLGAVAVDLSIVQLRQREAVAGAASAANDAVTFALDQDALRRGDGYRLDADRVVRAVDESLDAQGLTESLTEPPTITMPTPTSVTVMLRMRVDFVFARSLPRSPRGTVVRGSATADVAER